MVDEERTLRKATRLAVGMGGVDVLRDSKRFLAYLSDVVDNDSPAMSALYAWCDDMLMGPFADAMEAESPQALSDAAHRGTEYLAGRAIDRAVAQEVCDSIVLGIGDATGLTPKGYDAQPEAGIPVVTATRSVYATAVDSTQVPPTQVPPTQAPLSATQTRSVPATPLPVAPTAQPPAIQPPVNQPTANPQPPRKNNTGVVAAVLAVIALVLAIAYFSTMSGGTVSGSTSASGQDVSEYISKAEQKAQSKDYAGALALIEMGLDKYPDSDALEAKKELYETQKATQEKEEAEEAQRKQEEARKQQEEQDKAQSQSNQSQSNQSQNNQSQTSTQSSASSFARAWSGTYIGTSNEVAEQRSLQLALTTVAEDGYIEGSVLIDYELGYYVAGSIDWSTGYVDFSGTQWINKGSLNNMCRFYGYLSSDRQSMSGTKVAITDVEEDLHPNDWQLSAIY